MRRSRIRYNHDGTLEVPSATAWDTSHQLAITRNLRDALGRLWAGEVDLLRGSLEWVRAPKGVEDLMAYLETRRAFIPDHQQRRRAGLWIAGTRVERFNDWAFSGRCKRRGTSRSPRGVLALAALEVARRNGEREHGRQERELPERTP